MENGQCTVDTTVNNLENHEGELKKNAKNLTFSLEARELGKQNNIYIIDIHMKGKHVQVFLENCFFFQSIPRQVIAARSSRLSTHTSVK